MAKRHTVKKDRKTKRSMKQTQRHRRMRGGADEVSAPTTTGNFSLPQGLAYFKNAPMNLGSNMVGGDSPFFGVKPVVQLQQGGMATYPGSMGARFLDAGLESQAGTAALDRAFAEVAGLRDPNQAGGRKRKAKKAQRKSKKAMKSQRKSKKAMKSQRKAKKSQRKSKKSRRGQRGGEMDLSESTKMLLDSGLLAKAGLHPSWADAETGRMV